MIRKNLRKQEAWRPNNRATRDWVKRGGNRPEHRRSTGFIEVHRHPDLTRIEIQLGEILKTWNTNGKGDSFLNFFRNQSAYAALWTLLFALCAERLGATERPPLPANVPLTSQILLEMEQEMLAVHPSGEGNGTGPNPNLETQDQQAAEQPRTIGELVGIFGVHKEGLSQDVLKYKLGDLDQESVRTEVYKFLRAAYKTTPNEEIKKIMDYVWNWTTHKQTWKTLSAKVKTPSVSKSAERTTATPEKIETAPAAETQESGSPKSYEMFGSTFVPDSSIAKEFSEIHSTFPEFRTNRDHAKKLVAELIKKHKQKVYDANEQGLSAEARGEIGRRTALNVNGWEKFLGFLDRLKTAPTVAESKIEARQISLYGNFSFTPDSLIAKEFSTFIVQQGDRLAELNQDNVTLLKYYATLEKDKNSDPLVIAAWKKFITFIEDKLVPEAEKNTKTATEQKTKLYKQAKKIIESTDKASPIEIKASDSALTDFPDTFVNEQQVNKYFDTLSGVEQNNIQTAQFLKDGNQLMLTVIEKSGKRTTHNFNPSLKIFTPNTLFVIDKGVEFFPDDRIAQRGHESVFDVLPVADTTSVEEIEVRIRRAQGNVQSAENALNREGVYRGMKEKEKEELKKSFRSQKKSWEECVEFLKKIKAKKEAAAAPGEKLSMSLDALYQSFKNKGVNVDRADISALILKGVFHDTTSPATGEQLEIKGETYDLEKGDTIKVTPEGYIEIQSSDGEQQHLINPKDGKEEKISSTRESRSLGIYEPKVRNALEKLKSEAQDTIDVTQQCTDKTGRGNRLPFEITITEKSTSKKTTFQIEFRYTNGAMKAYSSLQVFISTWEQKLLQILNQ